MGQQGALPQIAWDSLICRTISKPQLQFHFTLMPAPQSKRQLNTAALNPPDDPIEQKKDRQQQQPLPDVHTPSSDQKVSPTPFYGARKAHSDGRTTTRQSSRHTHTAKPGQSPSSQAPIEPAQKPAPYPPQHCSNNRSITSPQKTEQQHPTAYRHHCHHPIQPGHKPPPVKSQFRPLPITKQGKRNKNPKQQKTIT